MNEAAVLQIVVRTFAALLFAVAAFGKLGDRAGFEGVVGEYRLLPSALGRPPSLVTRTAAPPAAGTR